MSWIGDKLASRLPVYSTITALSLVSYKSNSVLSSYKPLLGDFLRSSSILLSVPIAVGDRVSINTNTGRVQSLSFLYVVLDSKECTTYIPTHTLHTSVIKKYKQ